MDEVVVESSDFQFMIRSFGLVDVEVPPNDLVWIIPESNGLASVSTRGDYAGVVVRIRQDEPAPAVPATHRAVEFSIAAGHRLEVTDGDGTPAFTTEVLRQPSRVMVRTTVVDESSPDDSDDPFEMWIWPCPSSPSQAWNVAAVDSTGDPAETEADVAGNEAAAAIQRELARLTGVSSWTPIQQQTGVARASTVLRTTMKDAYRLFSAHFNWLTRVNGAYGASVGEEFWFEEVDALPPGSVVPPQGKIGCTFLILDYPDTISMSWNWLAYDGITDQSMKHAYHAVLARPSRLDVSLRRNPGTKTEIELTLSHRDVPPAWADSLSIYWQWQLDAWQDHYAHRR